MTRDDFELDDDIFSNNAHYFFSLFEPRFDAMNQLMAAALSRKFGHEFRPIKIFSARPNAHFSGANYLVLNAEARKAEAKLNQMVVGLQKQEDINREFCQSTSVRNLVQKLHAKQQRVFVYPFTTSFLEVQKELTLLGPLSNVATRYDNKIEQWKLFQQLDLPTVSGKIFESQAVLVQTAADILPCYINASYTSGGEEGALISSTQELESFLAGVRPINLKGQFLATEVFESIVLAPNVSAIVTGENRTYVLFISDQILRGNKYWGNIYPSLLSTALVQEVSKIATIVGNHISMQGYRGLFGLDFLVNDKGKLVVVDLNPRRQGAYLCNALVFKKLGIDLAEVELRCALNEHDNTDWEVQLSSTFWAHSKVIPPVPGIRIVREIQEGDIQKIFAEGGGCYKATFYQSGSLFLKGNIGYVVAVGNSRKEVSTQVARAEKELLEEVIEGR